MATYNPPKKNTAFIIYVGLKDQADGNLFKAAPTLAAGDFKVSKDGAALGNLATLPTVTPAAGKMVKISLSAAEMNADNVTLVCSDASGAEWADLMINFQTVANQFDDLDTAIDAIPTAVENRTEMDSNSTQLTAIVADTGELQTNQGNWLTATGFSTHDAAAVKTAIEAGGSSLAQILADTGELQTNQGNWLTATGFSTHNAAAVWAVVTRVLTAGTNLNDISAGDVAAELATYDGPTKAELDSGLAGLNDPAASAIADAVLDELLSGHTTPGSLSQAVIDILADTGELQTNQGNWLTATGFSTHDAAAVKTAVEAGGSHLALILADTGELQTNQGNWVTAVGFSTHAAADVVALLNDLSASETAAAVWDALIASYQDVGSTGEALNDAGGAGTPPTVEEIRTEMDSNSTQLAAIVGDTGELQTNQGNWLTATGFSTHDAAAVKTAIEAAGSHLALILADTAELQGNQANWATATGFSTHDAAAVKTAIEAAGSHLALILADTADLQGNQGNWLTATGFSTHTAGNVWEVVTRTLTSGAAPSAVAIRQEMDSNSTQLAAIVADTNELQQDDIPALIAALENLSAAQARAQMVSALSVDTYAEPTSKPAATASITAKLAWLQVLSRNKVTQDDTTQTLYKDDGVSPLTTAPVSQAAGVVTRGEFV